MRSLQPAIGLLVLIAACGAAVACSTTAGGTTVSASATSSPAQPATSAAPPSTSPSPASTESGSGGGRGDYDYDYGTDSSPEASASASVEIRVATGELGDYLTDARGMTLYTFKPDDPNVSTCEDACVDAWPPLIVAAGGNVSAGDGVSGTLATFERSDGTLQVSYDGAPLYFFARDGAPGDVNGHGAGDAWYVAEP